MEKMISGTTTMSLANADAGGNMGYSLNFDFRYQKNSPMGTIEYSNIKFSGPGSWSDYSEGDDYPYSQMLSTVLSDS